MVQLSINSISQSWRPNIPRANQLSVNPCLASWPAYKGVACFVLTFCDYISYFNYTKLLFQKIPGMNCMIPFPLMIFCEICGWKHRWNRFFLGFKIKLEWEMPSVSLYGDKKECWRWHFRLCYPFWSEQYQWLNHALIWIVLYCILAFYHTGTFKLGCCFLQHYQRT